MSNEQPVKFARRNLFKTAVAGAATVAAGGLSVAQAGICQDTSKKLVRSLFIPEEPQQGLCPYASLPQDFF